MNHLYSFSKIKLILSPYHIWLTINTERLTSLLRAADTTKPGAEEEIPKTFWLDFILQMCLVSVQQSLHNTVMNILQQSLVWEQQKTQLL